MTAFQTVMFSGQSACAGLKKYHPVRIRPGSPKWPKLSDWAALKQKMAGEVIKVEPLFFSCGDNSKGSACLDLIGNLGNPYFLGDQASATQISGWVDAWRSSQSGYAIRAQSAADIAAGVNFAREHNLRLAVKGGGHSYQGTSSSADSLLLWTRAMNAITLHDDFIGQGCGGTVTPSHAVTVGAGAIWMDVYQAVTTQGGRYVQGGGCATVGVAGHVQSGGFGSFSKQFGMSSSNLLEAEVVTADGSTLIANPCTNPDLFWAIKGGGGGSWGVVTRLTMKTHDLPNYFGVVQAKIKAENDDEYLELISKFISFYASSLSNSHWGEQVKIGYNKTLKISLECQGLEESAVKALWAPFIDWVNSRAPGLKVTDPFVIGCVPAQRYWDVEFLKTIDPGSMISDPRPGAPKAHVWWSGDAGQVSEFVHGYQSVWLPSALLKPDQQYRLAKALLASSKQWTIGLHFNKGLFGASQDVLGEARNTAMNPAVLDAFALAIISGEGAANYPGSGDPALILKEARANAHLINMAMKKLRTVAPVRASYVAESDYFEPSWQTSFWGSNYNKLRAVKKHYDPEGLFFVRHGVDSEDWSDDGFSRI